MQMIQNSMNTFGGVDFTLENSVITRLFVTSVKNYILTKVTKSTGICKTGG